MKLTSVNIEHVLIYLIVGVIIDLSSFSTAKRDSEPSSNDSVVETPSGKLRGSVLQTWTNQKLFSFRGIPFAEPPLGNLRFKVQ